MLDLGTHLDFEKVYEAMKNGRPILAFEFDSAIECVVTLTNKFLAADLQRKEIQSIEVEYLLEGDSAMPGHHGFMDLVVLLNVTGGYTIVDWKTTGTLDAAWVDRHKWSWQGPLYVAAFRETRKLDWDIPVDVEFRGITRGKSDGAHGTKTLVIDISKQRLDATVHQYKGVRKQILHQIETEPQGPWPMRMPDACFAYNRTCPYLIRCSQGTQKLGTPQFTTLSYSSMNSFGACNEKWRQERLDRDQSVDTGNSPEAEYGNTVHRGMAEIYRQVREAPERFLA